MQHHIPSPTTQSWGRDGFADTQISMLPGRPGSAMCVQNLDDSRGLAIRITYRISLRSSSLWEPRHPLLKVVISITFVKWTSRRSGVHPLTSGFCFRLSCMKENRTGTCFDGITRGLRRNRNPPSSSTASYPTKLCKFLQTF